MATISSVELPPEIIDLEDYTESINIMLHSDTGGGKTIQAAGLPYTLIIAAEEGTISAKRAGLKSKVWRVKNWEDFMECKQWLLDNPDHPFKWVIVDTITKLQSYCIRWIMSKVVENNPTRDPHIPSQGDHFKWQLMMKEMVEDFNDMDCNILWVAQSMKREDEEGNEIVLPLIEGKDYQISAWVCAQMHMIVYLRKIAPAKEGGRPRRYIYTDHHRYYSKDRYGLFEPVIKNPNLREMVKQIEDSETKPPPRKVAGSRRATKKTTAKKTARKRTSSRSN